MPIFTQSGDSRYENADKMIIKEAQVLPHGLINNVEDKLGYEGEKLEEYVDWLRNRIIKLRRDKSYNPVIHKFFLHIGRSFLAWGYFPHLYLAQIPLSMC